MLGEDCQNGIKAVLLFDEVLMKNLPRVHWLEAKGGAVQDHAFMAA